MKISKLVNDLMKVSIFTILLLALSIIVGIFLSNIFYERAEVKDYREVKNKCILFEIEKILIFYYLENGHYPSKKDLIELARNQGYPDGFGCGLAGIKEVNNITDIYGNELVYEIVEANDVVFYFKNSNAKKLRLQSNRLIK